MNNAIIFDLDGTLIHSAPDLHAAMNAALTRLGRPLLDLPTLISFIGNGVETLVQRSLLATGVVDDDMVASALHHFADYYSHNMTTLTHAYPGVIACLEHLKVSGVKLGICTNKPEPFAVEICATMGLDKYVDVIIGARPDMAKKPDPAMLHACIAGLQSTAAHSLYVGDSAVDFETARNANVPFKLYSQGYLNTDLPDLADSDRFHDWSNIDVFTH